MKKKLSLAKAPLPKFRAEKDAADYFETHSVADVWDQLPQAEPAKASKALEKSIRERHSTAKSPISIRLACEQIRGQEDRRSQIGRLPDAVAHVDS